MASQENRRWVALFDDPPLRRVAYARLLEPWLREQAFDLLAFGFHDREEPDTSHPPVLQVVVLGSKRVDDQIVRAELAERRRKWPQTPIVIVSDHAERGEMAAAYRCGVQGFFPSNLEPDVALRAFALILAGGTFFPPEMLDGATPPAALPERGNGPSLTPRQLDVLALLREGKSNKLIARDLSMCESTVKVHVRQIMRKLGAANRTQAALSALSPIESRSAQAFDVNHFDLGGRDASRDRNTGSHQRAPVQSARAR